MATAIHLLFQKAGLQTSVQDRGRIGYQAFGVPIGGAMDQKAARLANELVGNSIDEPVIEITLIGPKIVLTGTAQIAITGADLSPQFNGFPLPMYETITLKEKGLLSFGKIKNACRAYLAIGGQWQIPQWLGSYSAAMYSTQIITPNSIIRRDSFFTIQPQRFISKKKAAPLPYPTSNTTISIMAGPEFGAFSNHAIGHFFSQTYRISNDSNRMGYRLLGSQLALPPDSTLISSGIIPGTIQINNAGLPIILMRDAQTTGGYLRIANVLNEDLNLLAQMKPGETLRFVLSKKDKPLTA